MRIPSWLLAVTLAAWLPPAPAAAQEPVDLAMTARIREEGLQRSPADPEPLPDPAFDPSPPGEWDA